MISSRCVPLLASLLPWLGFLSVPSIRCCSAQEPRARAIEEFRVVGYLPDYRFSQFPNLPIDQLTDLVLFSAEPNRDGTISMERLSKTPWDAIDQAKTKHRFRLILCVGGWERSVNFEEVAANPSLRRRFIQDALQLCLRRRIDGIDLDWEHPKTPEQIQNYGQLIMELQRAFAERGLLVSATIAAWQDLPRDAIASLDALQIMAYDHPKRHSTREDAMRDIEAVLKKGATERQVVLGLPFYARHIERNQETMTYENILEKFHPPESTDEVEGFYFNGKKTILQKLDDAHRLKLGGVMVWEIGQDATGESSLLRAIRSRLLGSR